MKNTQPAKAEKAKVTPKKLGVRYKNQTFSLRPVALNKLQAIAVRKDMRLSELLREAVDFYIEHNGG